MELRSTRSRSKTPFLTASFINKEIIEEGNNHVEQASTVIKTTRKTTTTTRSKGATSTIIEDDFASNVKPATRKTRSEKFVRRLAKTSDYSSEDGDNEVTSTKTISQNERNQFMEDARALANGTGDVTALDLYRKVDRYWDKYPKTDYTYSYHSRDRFEISPGEVIMPNMSRRTIHSLDSSFGDTMNKSTNTESETYNHYYRGEHLQRKKLFNNNYNDVTVEETRVSWYKRTWRRIISTVVTIFTTIFAGFYYLHSVQTSVFAKLHRFSSRVMLLDTLLMMKGEKWNKTNKLVLLCLLPLLFFAAWWFLSNLGSLLLAALFNTTESLLVAAPIASKSMPNLHLQSDDNANKHIEEKIVKVTENSYIQPPSAREVAAELSADQLDLIASALKSNININEQFDTEEIVKKILTSPSFVNVVNNYKTENIINSREVSDNIDLINSQQNLINNLREEINKIKQEIVDKEKERNLEIERIIANFKNEQMQNSARLTYQLNKCCQKSIINIEDYVHRIVTSYLNNNEFLNNQKGFNSFLQTMFVAKSDLENTISNLTSNLNADFDHIVEDNGRKILNEINNKIALEMTSKLTNIKHTKEKEVYSISDERVREIVKNTLAIYDADKTGLVDYAMESMGGQVITTRCTETYNSGKAVVSVLGVPLWYPVNTPRTVITPGINPGECWAFQNFPGFLVVKLIGMVQIDAFSVEHVNRLLVPNGEIDSAPKNFEVYGLTSDKDKDPVKLGDYTYDYDGESLQFFAVQSEKNVFDHIEIRIKSNHGNPQYTCLYRFRVHGKLFGEGR